MFSKKNYFLPSVHSSNYTPEHLNLHKDPQSANYTRRGFITLARTTAISDEALKTTSITETRDSTNNIGTVSYFEPNWTPIDNLNNVQCTGVSRNVMLRLQRIAFEYYRELVVTGFWRMRYIRTGNHEVHTRPRLERDAVGATATVDCFKPHRANENSYERGLSRSRSSH